VADADVVEKARAAKVKARERARIRSESHLVLTEQRPSALTALLDPKELLAPTKPSPSVLMELNSSKENAEAEVVKARARARNLMELISSTNPVEAEVIKARARARLRSKSHLVPTVRSPCALTALLKLREFVAPTTPSLFVLMELKSRKDLVEAEAVRTPTDPRLPLLKVAEVVVAVEVEVAAEVDRVGAIATAGI